MAAFGIASFFLVSLILGSMTLTLVVFSKKYSTDVGIRSFLYPLIPLGLFAFSEYLGRLALLSGIAPTIFREFSKFIRLSFGLGWVLFCHRHYVLNGAFDFRRFLTVPFIVLTAANYAFYCFLLLAGLLSEDLYRINILIMSLTALYAGISAFFLLTYTNKLLPSSWAGLGIAGVSLVVYPLAMASDVFGYRYPFFDPGLLVWEQTFPLYYFFVSVFVLPLFFKRDFFSQNQMGGMPPEPLTRREDEVIRFLAAGKSYKEISTELQISLSTVKTHVANAYRKLGISKQRDISALIGEFGPDRYLPDSSSVPPQS